MNRKILGIVGSYRKGCVVDSLVSETLAGARERGATVEKIHLIDRHIEFCNNCRACTQEPGEAPGTCVHRDDMDGILAKYLACDGVVLGAPVNCFNVTAVTRKFMERLLGFAYWPWGQPGPRVRVKDRGKQAVLVTATAMPAIMARVMTGAVRALRITAEGMGAKPIATISVGMIAMQPRVAIPPKALRRAREAGRRLAAG